jgi:hypothetical protein
MAAYNPTVLRTLLADTTDFREVFNLPDTGEMAAVVCHFNPSAYAAPIQNLQATLRWLGAERLPTFAVEVRCGRSLDVPPVLPVGHPRVLQLTGASSIFRKDNLWNVMARRLPLRYRFVLCLDADSLLLSNDWQPRLLDALKERLVVQPFTTAVWTDSAQQAFKRKPSCGLGWQNGRPNAHLSSEFHSGFAIAVRREFWEATPGFYNSPIGGGSLFFVAAAVGQECEVEPTLESVSRPFLDHLRQWERATYAWVHGSFGAIEGEAVHLWHGSRAKRQYMERFKRLATFVPDCDIVSTAPYGVHEWSQQAFLEKPQMVQAVKDYFSSREEDEIFVATTGNR